MESNRIPRKVLFSQIESRRPKHRWIEAVERNADTLLKIKRWTSIVKDRKKRRRRIMEAKFRLQTVTPWKKKKKKALNARRCTG